MIRFKTVRLMKLEPGKRFTLEHKVYYRAPVDPSQPEADRQRFSYHKCMRLEGERAEIVWLSGQEFVTIAEVKDD